LTKNLFFGLSWSRNLDKNPFIENKGCFSQGFPVKKKTLIAAIIISALLFSAVVGIQFLQLGKANPYIREYGPPDAYTKPPKISIFAPKNNTAYMDTTIPLTITVSLPESSTASYTHVRAVYYEADWLEKRVYLYQSKGIEDIIDSYRSDPKFHYFRYAGILSGVPSGNHSIVVHAEGGGAYPPKEMRQYIFSIYGSSSVFFTTGIPVDTTPPEVAVMPIENRTGNTTDAPLNFTVNEPTSKITYSLDRQENVTFAGNTTLTNLPYGEHNITVFATDEVGNTGASKTAFFTIEEPPAPFSTTIVIAPLASVAFVSAGLLFYFKKRQGGKYQ
jgi:hypothetical protein